MENEDLRIAKEIELVESVSELNSPRPAMTADPNNTSDDTSILKEGLREESEKLSSPNDAVNSDYLIGKVIGNHYEIISQIGQGGMSTVYKARHQLLNRDVAVKFLAGRQLDSRAYQRFQEEARAAVGLQHANICATREFGITEHGIPYLVMDFLQGTSLSEAMQKSQTFAEARAIELMLGICAGLKHAHESGVIHRDIKPANILITEDRSGKETIKIVDFGIAKLIREDDSGPNLTQTGEVFGTPKYMSPEQCYGNKVDRRADIYALGCILYEMLSGQPPFTSESAIQILFAHVNNEPAPLADKISKSMRAIVQRCLQKEPSIRYQDISELMADLEAVKCGEQPVHARSSLSNKAQLVLVFSVVTIIALIVSTVAGIAINGQSATKSAREWETAHAEVLKLRRANNISGEEKQLEKCLEIALDTHNDSITSLTLQELANAEETQGKTEEAEEHRKSLTHNIKANSLRKSFLSLSFALIGFGVLIFVFFMIWANLPRNKVIRDAFILKQK